MAEIIQGKWDELIGRQDLHGRSVRIIVLDESDSNDDPWLKSLRAWADRHEPLAQAVEDGREGIYSGYLA